MGRYIAVFVAVALGVFIGGLGVVAVASDEGVTFADVPATNPHAADIAWLAGTGITRGCNPPANDRFCPDQTVTRAQMATFMHRLYDRVLTDVPAPEVLVGIEEVCDLFDTVPGPECRDALTGPRGPKGDAGPPGPPVEITDEWLKELCAVWMGLPTSEAYGSWAEIWWGAILPADWLGVPDGEPYPYPYRGFLSCDWYWN